MDDPATIIRAGAIAKEIMEATRPALINDIARGIFEWIAETQRQFPDMSLADMEALWFDELDDDR